MTLLQGVAAALDTKGVETAAVAAIVLLGKVWDRFNGRRKDRERHTDRQDLNRRLDEHATSDLLSFNKIDTSLQLIDQALNNGLREDIREIKERLNHIEYGPR